jgi:hypothetical protein
MTVMASSGTRTRLGTLKVCWKRCTESPTQRGGAMFQPRSVLQRMYLRRWRRAGCDRVTERIVAATIASLATLRSTRPSRDYAWTIHEWCILILDQVVAYERDTIPRSLRVLTETEGMVALQRHGNFKRARAASAGTGKRGFGGSRL